MARAPLLALAALLAHGPLSGCARPAAEAAPGSPRSAERFVVFESNRTGDFRIWLAPLDGAQPPALRRLSPDDPGRDHCCAAISPDGARVVYLALPRHRRRYLPRRTPGELRLIELESGRSRVLSTSANHDGESRAAIWWSPTELVYLESDDTTRKLDLAAGTNETIVPASEGGGWLVAPGGRAATGSKPTFSVREPSGAIRLATDLGGCQPTFTFDGELGLWSAGAGGPLDLVDLETRETRSIVRRGDVRLPQGRRYLYFPAISADRTLFGWAASNDTHDHFHADYDVYVAEVDPESLALTGAPLAVAPHPAVDRYPALFS
ncbi:MAG: TolB family protein, partial [Myxococcota bacterium]